MAEFAIENHTELPRAVVQRCVRWTFRALEIENEKILVRVSWTDREFHRGHLRTAPSWRPGDPYVLAARIPRIVPYSCYVPIKGGPPPVDPQTYEESLVCILAHEGAHVRQLKDEPKRKGYRRKEHRRSTRGGALYTVKAHDVRPAQFNEREAEWAEYVLLSRYRERRKQ